MRLLVAIILGLTISTGAYADVWKWTDTYGDTHFVDSMKSIYTWLDDSDKVHYSDKPGHEDAVAVVLVWHSKGRLDDIVAQGSNSVVQDDALPGESAEDVIERKLAEAYYCKRATEIYDSYKNAPRLYKTDADGERAYLSDTEAAQTLAETKAKVTELCH